MQRRARLLHRLRDCYHRLPLSARSRVLIRNAYGSAFHGIKRKAVTRAVPGTVKPGSIARPSNQRAGKPDYVIWGVIDWHFRHQRPQQLALALSKTGRRVFYVSQNFADDDRTGFMSESLDTEGRLFQINLFVKNAPVIYSSAPDPSAIEQLRSSIGDLLAWADCGPVVSLIQHPFWLEIASALPNSATVYDCLDHHAGFGDYADSLFDSEQELLRRADLTIATSRWLYEAAATSARRRVVIHNASDYRHFSKAPEVTHHDGRGRRIIGYYGAIAEWFDTDLVEAVARRHPECSVLLIGADTVNARSKLSGLANVTFTGEVPYARLPFFLHSFDVCLLPFRVMPLTLATDPVKAYEYLSAGKPVVAVDLPELAAFAGLIALASSCDEFLGHVTSAVNFPDPPDRVLQRQKFAQGQTWTHRAAELIAHAELRIHEPWVSVVIVTYNNLHFTRACLDSLELHSQYDRLQLIVVDNGSCDGSRDFLKKWVTAGLHRNLKLNTENRGFAAANNQGLALATGEYLVLLNNDTHVTPGWIRTLIGHLRRDSTIGLIGPVTNNIGNEAKVDIAYADMSEMLVCSSEYIRRNVGRLTPLTTAAFFCVMMPRSTYAAVGELNEAFGLGFFEDDDYCRRVEQEGLRIVCADDVFIHHHLSASFESLGLDDRKALFDTNRRLYEAMWGEWIPHEYRKKAIALHA